MVEVASTALAIAAPRKSVLVDMANRYGMEPSAFEMTVRATCMKPDKNGRVPSREEFAAFLLVAKEYRLNPLTKEIYAFSDKSGGIVPVVSVDGWLNLINSHPACDGFEFDFDHDENKNLVSTTCRMYRKDRSRPVVVTEWLLECIRSTAPWAMKHRMLRHKALIQAGRYAFGFAGIYDEDEAGKIVANRNAEINAEFTEVSSSEPPAPANDESGPPAPPEEVVKEEASPAPEEDTGPPEPSSDYEIPADGSLPEFLRRHPEDVPPPIKSERGWLAELNAKFAEAKDMSDLADAQQEHMLPYDGHVSNETWVAASEILDSHIQRVQAS